MSLITEKQSIKSAKSIKLIFCILKKQLKKEMHNLDLITKYVIISCLIIWAQTLNTHQNITASLPHVIPISIKQNDTIRISVFDANAQYTIIFQNLNSNFSTSKSDFCFNDQKCSFQFISQFDGEGVILVQVLAYKYSYEILLNEQIIYSQNSIVEEFIGGKFTYSKPLDPGKYQIFVYFQSKNVKKMSFQFINSQHIVEANKKNKVTLKLTKKIPLYELTIKPLADGYSSQIDQQQKLIITISLPNVFLYGCDGNNQYDHALRQCPLPVIPFHKDFIVLHNIGKYPTFNLKESEKVMIKITIFEFIKWRQIIGEANLTVYVANGSDSTVFNNMSQKQIQSKFRTKQQCKMKSLACTFMFQLQGGEYTVMPVFPENPDSSFVYLFQRSIQQTVVQSYYSVLPTYQVVSQVYFHQSSMIQFISFSQNLTTINIESQNEFILLTFTIFEKDEVESQDGELSQQIVLTALKTDQTYNQNLHKIRIKGQFSANSSYILQFVLASKCKILEHRQRQNNSSNVQQEQFDYKQMLYEGPKIEINIENGKFPHRKIKQLLPSTSQNLTSDSQMSQDAIKYIIGGTILILAVFVILLTVKLIKRFKNSKDLEAKELITEQKTGNITVGQSSIEISTISNTEG